MAKKDTKKAAVSQTSEEATPTVSEQSAGKKQSAEAVAVYKGSTVVRIYSKERHGADYKALAKQYVEKYATDKNKLTIQDYVAPEPPKPSQDETEIVRVIHPSGDLVRTFSLRQHGKDYRKLAEQFVEKYASRKYTLA